MTPKYKRILLKFSGEVLMGSREFGMEGETIERFAGELRDVASMGVEMGLVIGGGNFFRGGKQSSQVKIPRTVADQVGMLATVMNGIVLVEALKTAGVESRILSSVAVDRIAPLFTQKEAIDILEQGKILILAGGTGHPFFTTDTGAALRAAEIGAEIILKGTKVDGVYDEDPAVNKNAVRFDSMTYKEVLQRGLKVMDITAISFCMENRIPIRVFNIRQQGSIKKVVCGEGQSSLICV
jgi:uridylate kinase